MKLSFLYTILILLMPRVILIYSLVFQTVSPIRAFLSEILICWWKIEAVLAAVMFNFISGIFLSNRPLPILQERRSGDGRFQGGRGEESSALEKARTVLHYHSQVNVKVENKSKTM